MALLGGKRRGGRTDLRSCGTLTRHPIRVSYRDPSGHVFPIRRGGLPPVNPVYREHYDHLVGSGLQRALVDEGLVLHSKEVETPECRDAYRTIQPEQVSFISYPYEWSFSQLSGRGHHDACRAAARTGIRDGPQGRQRIQHSVPPRASRAHRHAVVHEARGGGAVGAYRQFCQHFVAPLALMAHTDVRCHGSSRRSSTGLR